MHPDSTIGKEINYIKIVQNFHVNFKLRNAKIFYNSFPYKIYADYILVCGPHYLCFATPHPHTSDEELCDGRIALGGGRAVPFPPAMLDPTDNGSWHPLMAGINNYGWGGKLPAARGKLPAITPATATASLHT